jgi:hypothetical protein
MDKDLTISPAVHILGLRVLVARTTFGRDLFSEELKDVCFICFRFSQKRHDFSHREFEFWERRNCECGNACGLQEAFIAEDGLA